VTNNPLAFVDPTGFSEEPAELLPGPNTQLGPDGELEIVIRGQPKEKETNDTASAAEVGAAAPPTDVDTTGSSPDYDPHAETTAPDEWTVEEDWTQHSLVQVEGGFLGGLGLGMVPFGGAIANAITDPGTRWAEIGKGVGEIFGGGFAVAGGVAGILGGGAASGTGVLTLPGVALVVGSATLVAGGIANVKAGAERFGQALSMSSGSGSGNSGTQETRFPTRGMGGRTLSSQEKAQFDVFGERAARAGLHPSPYRTGSWGKIDSSGKYNEVIRIDVAEAGQPGWRGQTHMHVEGMNGHLPLTTKIPGEL
jgi:hypothetical protein